MKYLLIVILFLVPVAAHAQTVCGDRGKFIEQLSKAHREAPAGMGVTLDGKMVELLRSKTGSWSILVTNGNGVTCMVAVGDGWQEVKKMAGTKS